jgi:hypothetical protein
LAGTLRCSACGAQEETACKQALAAVSYGLHTVFLPQDNGVLRLNRSAKHCGPADADYIPL